MEALQRQLASERAERHARARSVTSWILVVLAVIATTLACCTRLAHTIPDQAGRIFDLTKPRMGALWHLDVTPGVESVFDEVGAHYGGPVTVTQDLTVFNVTREAVVVRQAKVNDARPPVHGPSQTSPVLEPQPMPPAWWSDALLDF